MGMGLLSSLDKSPSALQTLALALFATFLAIVHGIPTSAGSTHEVWQ